MWFLHLSLAALLLQEVVSHGRMVEPPGRSSMWRFGFNVPKNYNDHQLNCGGYGNHWNTNGGKCGVCGDPYQGPLHNEPPGKYATGIIGKTYNKGQIINVAVLITANHKGYFQFQLCPNNKPMARVAEECLRDNPLQMADGSGTRWLIGDHTGWHNTSVRLPTGVTCRACVLRWYWHTGSSWGMKADGKGCRGCGDRQEIFMSCADISILPEGASVHRNSVRPSGSGQIRLTRTLAPPSRLVNYISNRDRNRQGNNRYNNRGRQRGDGFMYVSSESDLRNCYATDGPWKNVPGMDIWCQLNCAAGIIYCPNSHCQCAKKTFFIE